MSSLQKKVLTSKIPRGLPPRPLGGRGSSRGGRGGRPTRVFTPVHWSRYFRNTKKIKVNSSEFHAYLGKKNCIEKFATDRTEVEQCKNPCLIWTTFLDKYV